MLAYEVETSGPTTVVGFADRVHPVTAVDLRTALDHALAERPGVVVLDLDATDVEDGALAGLTDLVRSAEDWPGCPVLVSVTDPVTRRRMDRMAVTRSVAVYRDRAAALAAARLVRTPPRIRRSLASAADASTIAREMMLEACLAWNLSDLIDDAALVITELVSNAVQHAGEPIELMAAISGYCVRMSVFDHSPVHPVRILPDPESGEGGRGLILVDAVASDWGSRDFADGKVVWATLRSHQ
jgi:anti-sigma regulatory factor (Ser/Thr protein kinase)